MLRLRILKSLSQFRCLILKWDFPCPIPDLNCCSQVSRQFQELQNITPFLTDKLKATVRRSTKMCTFFVLLQKRVEQRCSETCRKQRTDLLFARKSLHFARFTGLRQTSCFAASDVTPVYGLTPVQFYPIRSQCSHNLHQLNFLQGSFELAWKRGQHSISTSFAAKQVARFCYLFYPSLKSQSNFKTKRTKKPYFYSPILLILKKRIT